MQAAHYAAEIPLLMGYVFHRAEGIIYAGIVKSVDVKTTDNDDPEHQVSDRAQIIKWVQCRPKNVIEPTLQAQKNTLTDTMYKINHWLLLGKI